MKKIALIALMLVGILTLTACAPSSFQNAKPEKYLTLGKYKGITAKERSTEVTDFDVESKLNAALKNLGYGEEVYNTQEGGIVAINDILNIDYKGMKDGVAFESGTAEGASLTIGSNAFITGFERQLVGVEVGQTVNINLTFPTDYKNTELAGQDVVFIVTVNAITGKASYPALTDALAKEIDKDVSSAQALRDKIKTTLQEEREAEVETLHKNFLWNQVVEGTDYKKEIPSSLAKPLKGEYDSYYLSIAKQYGYDTIDELLKASNIDYENYAKGRDLYCQSQGRSLLTAYAIAEAEGYSVPDKEFNEKAAKMAAAAGYSDVTTYLSNVGRDRLYDQFILDFAVNTVLENAVIK